jgi:hypothetical protein
MALNPALNDISGEPFLGDDDELFLIRRDRVNFSVKESRLGKFSARGSLFLTTESLFFVASSPKSQRGCLFQSFRIPLTKMTKEKFNQPIFGANNLKGRVVPVGDQNILRQLDLQEFKFCFTFNEGGCGTFLPIFFRLMATVRQYGDEAAAQIAPQVLSGSFAAAYVDPSDPSTIYVSQPLNAHMQSRGGGAPASEIRGARPVSSRNSFVSQQPPADADAGSYMV